MKNYSNKKKLMAAIAVSATLMLPTLAGAKVSGPCGNCHTMHNSQDGDPMASTGVFSTTGALPAVGDQQVAANGSLLRYGCIGCHTGTNSSTTGPFVYNTTATYGTDTLAGGNFVWTVTVDDNTGHNIVDIDAADDTLGKAPGGTQTDPVTCAGTMGCHGNGDADEFKSIAGGHHGSGGSPLTVDSKTYTYTSGSTSDMSDAYRMLSGIKGIEDDDWEFTSSASDHNQYYGVDRDGQADNTAAANSISTLCANCHGAFHSTASAISSNNDMSSPWVRHPTDFDMANATGSEYAYYNGGDGTAAAPYSVDAPVATDTMTGATTDLLATVNVTTASADGSAIVTCISCHRAHGSPNADLLRWDYSGMDAHGGSNDTGCFICHTTKDDA